MLNARLFPVIASLEEAKRVGDASRAAGRGGIPGLPFGPALTVVLVVEDGERLAWVDSRTLEEIRSEDPFELARENLRSRTTRPLRRKAITPGRDAWFVGENDGLDSGRLLLHDLWAPLKAEMPGELLVRVALRGVVFCCSNVPMDMGCVDAAVDHFVAGANARGASTVESPWLAWTEQGWGQIELETS